MKHSGSSVKDKLYKCESNYIVFTHIFLYFLIEYFYVLHDERENILDDERKELERKLLLSLSSLEKIHYHFFHQKDLIEEIYYSDVPIIALNNDVSDEYIKEDIRKQIIELRELIDKCSFLLKSYKIRCMDTLHLLLSYYPKVTIINTAPSPPWLSISSNI